MQKIQFFCNKWIYHQNLLKPINKRKYYSLYFFIVIFNLYFPLKLHNSIKLYTYFFLTQHKAIIKVFNENMIFFSLKHASIEVWRCGKIPLMKKFLLFLINQQTAMFVMTAAALRSAFQHRHFFKSRLFVVIYGCWRCFIGFLIKLYFLLLYLWNYLNFNKK